MKAILGVLALACASLFAVPGVAVATDFISIGTGGVTGVYFPTGGAVCRLVNRNRQTHGVRCSTESSGGSIENINAVRTGEFQFGIAQSDWQHHAYHGTGQFEQPGRIETLRAVFAVHPEPFTLIVRKGSGIATFEKLKGRKVNIGNAGSGLRATMEVVMAAFGIKVTDFSLAAELNASETPQALCDGKIDAMIYTVGHPAAAITEAASLCNIEFVDVKGPPIDKLIKDNPYYRTAIIPEGMYRGTARDVTTFGVGATLITSSEVSDDVVYTVVKAVFDQFEDFKTLHPALAQLKEREMITEGLSAPLHDGARRYYKERGWLE